MRTSSFVILFAAVLMLAATAQSQDFDNAVVKTTRLSDHIAMLEGQGGNLAVCFGPDGVMIIDDQYAPMVPKLRAAIEDLDDGPVRFVLNTHWHGDHTGGNESFGESGSVIVAHDNVRARLSTDQFVPFFDMAVPAAPAAALPVVTFEESIGLHLNGQEIDVVHVETAHTDGDAIVIFRGAKVVHAGDTFFNGLYPFIDSSSGGTVRGVLAAVARLLELTDDSWQIIPGHGPLADRAALERYRDMLVATSEAVAKAKAVGKSAAEVVAMNPTADWDAEWGGGFLDAAHYTQVLYDALP